MQALFVSCPLPRLTHRRPRALCASRAPVATASPPSSSSPAQSPPTPAPGPSAGAGAGAGGGATVPTGDEPTLYDDLGLTDEAAPEKLPAPALRAAYLAVARAAHPDTLAGRPAADVAAAEQRFDRAARAWAVLGDAASRRLYDTAGPAGLAAVASLDARAAALRARLPGMPADELDHLADTGALVGALLSPAATGPGGDGDDAAAPADDGREDVCPRSIDEAVEKLRNAEVYDAPTVYYTLWWVYRFRVAEAEPHLTALLSGARGARAFALRRRAALALGVVTRPCGGADGESAAAALDALADALDADDYFLRYRAAEAVANIAMRVRRDVRAAPVAPSVLRAVVAALRRGADEAQRRVDAQSGFGSQESLFDLDAMPEETRRKLEAVFRKRREGEARARRTTMTPQLGVDTVGRDGDEPLEWLLKAASGLLVLRRMDGDETADTDATGDEIVELARRLQDHDQPLVRYAACKALFAITRRDEFAERIVDGLGFGIEHHYSQRVLIRDLGDLAYSAGAQAVAECPMVENSFKILALKNMLNGHDCDASKGEVRNVLQHMDSLL